jgi:23S rRNA pseudouridine1911/1915/1917 synthase
MNSVMTPITGSVEPGSNFAFRYDLEDEQRIDCYLAQQFSRYSRTFIQEMIRRNCVSVNNNVVTKVSMTLRQPDSVMIVFPNNKPHKPVHEAAQELNVRIIFEHPHFLILDKPAGVLVHPPHAVSSAVSLIDWLVLYDREIKHVGTIDRPGIVHRLDRDTSGLILVARTNYAHTIFGDLFRNRTIKKTYLAFVHGHPDRTGTITYAIGRDPANRFKRKGFAVADGHTREAMTHYTVKDYRESVSFMELKPVTGRTHQIRVHCATLGYPIVGDVVYGAKSPHISRQALHAAGLEFEFDNEKYQFFLPLPDDMQELLTFYSQIESF